MRPLLLAVTGALMTLSSAAVAKAVAPPVPEEPVAVVDVAVVPMDRDVILQHQTVEMRGSTITFVGPSKDYRIPVGARVINGRGKYLAPGLADMHTHVWEYSRKPQFLSQYIAYGVTTVRSLSGDPELLRLRESIANGELLAPRLWVSGPVVIGPHPGATGGSREIVVDTPEEARRAVAAQAAAGYDFIKVYDFLKPETFLAAVGAARQRGIYVIGHLPDAVPLETALASGLNEIAHVDELVSYHWIGYDPTRTDWQVDLTSLRIDHGSIPATAALVARYGQSVVSNLVTDETVYRGIADPAKLLQAREYRAVPTATLQAWRTSGRLVKWSGQQEYRRDVIQPFLREMIVALARAGLPLTVGSDLGVEGMVPGHHLVRDVELLEEAGLTPFDALSAATRNAALVARRMRGPDQFGTIAVGKRADLILLTRNPLQTVSNLRSIVGVAAGGRWLSTRDLQRLRRSVPGSLKPPSGSAAISPR